MEKYGSGEEIMLESLGYHRFIEKVLLLWTSNEFADSLYDSLLTLI